MRLESEKLIAHNRSVHNLVAGEYEERHSDIYNDIERARMDRVLAGTITKLRTGNATPLVLDYGAGTGNLTDHLLRAGAHVVSADVSEGMLEQIRRKFGNSGKCETVLLNGLDLSNFSDDTFDMVATYAVLHHVPDYIGIVKEFIRVVKPGGVIVIDHEAAPVFWKWNETYTNYLDELNATYNKDRLEIPITYFYYSSRDWSKTSFRRFVRRWKNRVKQYLPVTQKRSAMDNEEGDIHVYRHDHINWDKIWKQCAPKCELIERTDFLVCRERTAVAPVWNRWKDKCADMRMLIVRKV